MSPGSGATHGDLSYVYGRVGAILVQNAVNQVVISAEGGHEWLDLQAYSEATGPENPFDASVSSGHQAINDVKLRSQWSHAFDDRWDFTAWSAIAWGQQD